MNINVNSTYLQPGMSLTMQQRQNLKQQSEIQKKIEEITQDKTKNIYQQQADQIREERNLSDLSKEEEIAEKKQEEKKQKEQYEEKAQQLTRVYGSDTAEIIMQMDALLENAVDTENPESSDAMDASDTTDSTAKAETITEVVNEVKNTDEKSVIEEKKQENTINQ